MTSDLSDLINETTRDLLTDEPFPEPTEPRPEAEEIEAMLFDRACTATDGCEGMDPDGACCHGHPSWLLRLEIL